MIEMGVCEQKQVRGGDCSAQHPASRIAPAQHQLSRRGDANPFLPSAGWNKDKPFPRFSSSSSVLNGCRQVGTKV
jgi:hypothetical protein